MRPSRLSFRRLLHLGGVLARHALSAAGGHRLVAWGRLRRRLPPPDLSEPERLRLLFEELGGTFIKFGQMLALQPDILPPAYCNALFNLLDRVPPFSFEEVEEVLAAELGAGPAELFDGFERRPLAAASIGQVHVAYLDGEKVAVKVQRPSAAADFAGDVRLMKLAMAAIRRLRLRRLEWLVEPMGEFVAWTEEELDYRREARYMEELARNGRGQPYQRIPRLHRVTRRVLVMDFFQGSTVLDYLRAVESRDEVTLRRLHSAGFDHDIFAAHVVDNFLEQAFVHGVFHADLHPANLMILPGNVVGYLDFGITGGLSPFARRKMLAMTLAHASGDLDTMSEALFEVSATAEGSAERYREGLERLAEDWYTPGDGVLHLKKSFTEVMLEMLQLSKATSVWPEREVIKYFRSSIAIDGLIARFAPGLDLGSYLAEACAHKLRGMPGGALESYQLLGWPRIAGRRMLDGGRRAAEVLERLAAGELVIHADLGTPRRGAARRGWSAMALGYLTLVLAYLMTTTGAAEAVLGLNLFTAQALLFMGSLWTLLSTTRKLAASPKETTHA